jgi:hypothetical protein
MRAAAAAIVFILGAAVILVLANSLNSWVLGGLIGGLAALLISIPISVMLFTILSRRHELKLQTLHQELGEMGYVAPDELGYEEVYETDAYVVPDEEYTNQNVHRRANDVRALPAAGQSYASSQTGRRPAQALPQGRLKGTPTRDLASERLHAKRSRHEVNAMRSRFQTSALKAARREALRVDDVEVQPNHTRVPHKNIPQGQTSRSSDGQAGSSRQARPGSDLPRQQQTPQQNVSRRSLENTTGKQNRTRRPLSSGELHTTNRTPQTDSLQMNDLHSDTFRMRSPSPETENLRVHPQTGQMTRNPQIGQSPRNADTIIGNLNTPLVRRAPYLYDDDPLREALAQQIDEEPIVRRSSRHLSIDDAD